MPKMETLFKRSKDPVAKLDNFETARSSSRAEEHPSLKINVLNIGTIPSLSARWNFLGSMYGRLQAWGCRCWAGNCGFQIDIHLERFCCFIIGVEASWVNALLTWASTMAMYSHCLTCGVCPSQQGPMVHLVFSHDLQLAWG